MDAIPEAMRREAYEAWWRGDVAGYRYHCSGLADAYLDDGRESRAEHRRRRALTHKSPGCRWPETWRLALSPHQQEQAAIATAQPFGILTGTPGTGKTYAAARIAGACAANFGHHNVAVCAPTGKAAVRITQAMRSYGVHLQARTVHSLLEIGRNGHDGEGWGFQRHRCNPLQERFVIVDEPSMLDADLAAALFSACAPGTHVLLVGDPNQLPPVGHGAPLRDLIAAGVPCGNLAEIHRNDGGVVEACRRIREGREFEPGGNLIHIDAPPGKEIEAAERAIMNAAASDPLARSSVMDSQVIVATNKGPLGRATVNEQLRMRLAGGNVGGYATGNPFWVRDKVVCTRNGWYRMPAAGECYVANGEIGVVEQVDAKVSLVRFEGPERLVVVPVTRRKGEDDADDFTLAYAITCHKSQGSEWPVVVVLLDSSPGAKMVCSREWLYTAISRAGRLCVLVGKLGVAQMMVRRPSLQRRKTFLRELMSESKKRK